MRARVCVLVPCYNFEVCLTFVCVCVGAGVAGNSKRQACDGTGHTVEYVCVCVCAYPDAYQTAKALVTTHHRAKMSDGQPLTHLELRVGQELVIYSRRFMITGCDQATRSFYSELGHPQQTNFAAPEGQYDAAVKVWVRVWVWVWVWVWVQLCGGLP